MQTLIYLLIAGSIYLLIYSLIPTSSFDLRRVHLSFPKPPKKYSFSIFSLFLKPLNLINQALLRFKFLDKYLKSGEENLKTLKLKIGIAEFLMIKELLAVGGFFLVKFLFSAKFSLLGLLGFLLPDIYLKIRLNQYKREIARILPETIDLLDMAISAGLDFLSGIQWLSEKAQANPFVEQLQIMATEIRMGRSRTEALKGLSQRLNIPEVSSFVRTLIQAEKMGTSVAEAFNILSEDIRAQRYERGERYALKSSVYILFPLLFCILPVILIVVAGPIIIKFSTGSLFPQGGPGF